MSVSVVSSAVPSVVEGLGWERNLGCNILVLNLWEKLEERKLVKKNEEMRREQQREQLLLFPLLSKGLAGNGTWNKFVLFLFRCEPLSFPLFSMIYPPLLAPLPLSLPICPVSPCFPVSSLHLLLSAHLPPRSLLWLLLYLS